MIQTITLTSRSCSSIDKMMSSVGTLFCQYVSGYLGSSVERRDRRTEPLWSLLHLQDLLDE